MLIPVTDTISIDDSELSESFVRSSGPGGQNVNKVSSAVQLRFDVRASPSLPKRRRHPPDAARRQAADQGRRHRHNRADAPSAGAQPRRRARTAVRPDPPGGGAAGSAPRHQGAQGRQAQALEGKKHRGQIKSLRGGKPGARLGLG
ncbi:MAG: peptide chain release factor-like protein [Pseudolabrys sp.]